MNLIQWRKLDCIHKDVCFFNGIKCGESICKNIQPERTCKIERHEVYGPSVDGSTTRKLLLNCSRCGKRIGLSDNYCRKCGARVVL